jgi:hypothetical protein
MTNINTTNDNPVDARLKDTIADILSTYDIADYTNATLISAIIKAYRNRYHDGCDDCREIAYGYTGAK